MLEVIITYLSMWAPSLVAILGIVGTIVAAFNALAKHLAAAKQTIAELKDAREWKDATAKLDELAAQNAELARYNKLLLEQITRIRGYADEKEK